MRAASTILAALLVGTALAQQVVIRSSTQEVLLEVVIRDAHGKLVTKIDPAQVSVFENGVRQDVRSFHLVTGKEVRAEDEKQMAQTPAPRAAPGREAPRTTPAPLNPLRTVNVVCLVLNDLTPETRAFAFDAAQKFVNRELRPDTFIGVFTLDSTGLRPIFPFSNNREHLLKAVELASVNQLPTLAQSIGAILNGLSIATSLGPLGTNGLALPTTTNGVTVTESGAHGGATGNADGSSAVDPLGIRGDMGVATQAGLREIDALKRLVRQLSVLPFQKSVLLMSTGLTRPPDQIEYWDSLIHSANQGGITFYGLDVHGLDSDYDPVASSVALLQQTANLSAGQRSAGTGAGQTTARQGGGVNIGTSGAAGMMESMHQTDYLRYGVLSANTQEALRELSERTGGFIIANTNNVDKLLGRVMEDVDTHYEISYRPASEIDDGHFRKVEVKVAGKDLRVETRSGYFAVPDTGEGPLTAVEMAGLRALDTKPLPHAFDYETTAFRFRPEKGAAQYAIAFQVPIANLTATPEAAEKQHKFHASLLALVKNSQGEVVERVSKDVPSNVSDEFLPALRADSMTYEHAVNLAPGRYTVETAVVDEEGNRASANVLQIDNVPQPGLALSDIALVHRVQDLQRPPDVSDPFEIPGKRATPYVSTTLPAGAEPYIYFVVYPDYEIHDLPGLRAQFLKDGKVLANQKSILPKPDTTGAIPMAIRAILETPGSYEVRIAVEQGGRSVRRSLKYSIAAR